MSFDPTADIARQLTDNLNRIREQIASAACSSGRSPTAVTLVAVTKHLPIAITRALIAAGCYDLGESRPQELWSKSAQLTDLPVRWHMIGHLQRNKVRRTWPLIWLFHSIDSERLLATLHDEAAASNEQVDALLEVNISGSDTKHGLTPAEIELLMDRLPRYPAVRIRGLMTMADQADSTTNAETDFSKLRELRDRLALSAHAGASLEQLSMGMSGDFEAAVRQGATLIRVGSALIEGIDCARTFGQD